MNHHRQGHLALAGVLQKTCAQGLAEEFKSSTQVEADEATDSV
jgi:hypothetical protein